MTCKLGKLVTCHGGLLPLLLHLLFTSSCEIEWKTKTIISPLPQNQWPQSLAEWWLTLAAFTHKIKWPWPDHVANKKHYIWAITMPMVIKLSRMITCLKWLLPTITWSYKIMWQTEIIIYPLTQCQFWQDGDIQWDQPIKSHKPFKIWPHEFTWKIKNIFIYATTIPMATNPGRVVAYNE